MIDVVPTYYCSRLSEEQVIIMKNCKKCHYCQNNHLYKRAQKICLNSGLPASHIHTHTPTHTQHALLFHFLPVPLFCFKKEKERKGSAKNKNKNKNKKQNKILFWWFAAEKKEESKKRRKRKKMLHCRRVNISWLVAMSFGILSSSSPNSYFLRNKQQTFQTK